MHRTSTLFTTLLVLTVVISLSACKRKTAAGNQSTLSASIGGRQIRASIEGPASIQAEGDAASVTFGNHNVRIERERLMVDGQESGRFPASTMRVTLFMTNSTLAAVADGNNFVTTKIENK